MSSIYLSKLRFIWSLIILYSIILSGCIHLPRIAFLNDPLTADEHIALGVSYESQGLLDAAISEYNSALKKDKDNNEIYYYLGNVYYQKKDLNKAEKNYIKAEKRGLHEGRMYNNLALVYLSQGENLDKAELSINKAIDTDPDNKAYYLDTLSLIYIKTNRFQEAIDILKEAIKIVQNDKRLRESIDHNIAEATKGKGTIKDGN